MNKNISFEKPTLFKNFKKQVTFHVVNFCYVFPQKIDTWNMKHKKSTMLNKLLLACTLTISSVCTVGVSTSSYAASSNITQVNATQLVNIAYNMKTNMTQRNLSSAEKNLYQQMYNIANNQTSLYDPTIRSVPQQYENIRFKIQQQFATVNQLAINT